MRPSAASEEQKNQHSSIAEVVTMPGMILRQAAMLANGMGVPVTYYAGDDFDCLSIPDVVPQSPDDDFIPACWSISLASNGSWIVADAGRWDCHEVHVQPSTAT